MAADRERPPRTLPKDIPQPTALLLLAAQASVMIVLGVLLWYWSGRGLATMVDASWTQAWWGAALAAALVALAWSLFRGFPRLSDRLVRMQGDTYAFLGPKLEWGAIVFISLCAGVAEEVLFRAGLQTFLADRIGTPAAIALASAAFAMIHLAKPIITALVFVIGVIFGIVYWQTGSLLAVMIAHALYDVWALRWLHNEFLRLGIVGGGAEDAGGEPLANPPAPG